MSTIAVTEACRAEHRGPVVGDDEKLTVEQYNS
jgi:hypothetical protein